MSGIAKTPEPPYYAVIFTNLKTANITGYFEMADRMDALAHEMPGFLGIESVRDGLGITVSYWESLESIRNWRENAEHRLAQRQGYETWYQSFSIRICRVERAYGFDRAVDPQP